MKKTLLSLALAACFLAGAQAQLVERNPGANPLVPRAAKAPAVTDLGPNQMYMGPYASDALASSGLGLPSYPETIKMGVVLPLSLVQDFVGGEIKAIRFGVCAPISEAAVFLYPVTNLSNLTVGEPLIWQDVDATVAGWNQIELDETYTISTEGVQAFMLGYQYKQVSGSTDASYPLSVVNEGETLASYAYCKLNNSSQAWRDLGVSSYGNLSVQAIVENENFPAYNLKMSNLSCSSFAQADAGLDYAVDLCNMGIQTLTNYQLDLMLDGVKQRVIDSPLALTQSTSTYTGHLDFNGLASGTHTLSLRIVDQAGTAISDGQTLTAQFCVYQQDFPRQKQLIEHFTAQGCTYCPLGVNVLNALSNMRDDVAWVSIHNNFNGTDVFTISKGTSLSSYLGCNSYPSAAFNRFTGEDGMVIGLGYNASYTQAAAAWINSAYFDENPTPALANISLSSSSFDPETRQLKIKVTGQAASDITTVMGNNIAVTVYLTEDGLVARQLNQGTWVSSYTHNHVLRAIPTAYNGDAAKWTSSGNYEHEYTVTLDESWNPDNMHLVAAIHRKGTGSAKEVINCEQVDLSDLTGVKGDVTGDGNIDIADINEVINVMLGRATNAKADVTGDGNTDIADINAIINIMLGKG